MCLHCIAEYLDIPYFSISNWIISNLQCIYIFSFLFMSWWFKALIWDVVGEEELYFVEWKSKYPVIQQNNWLLISLENNDIKSSTFSIKHKITLEPKPGDFLQDIDHCPPSWEYRVIPGQTWLADIKKKNKTVYHQHGSQSCCLVWHKKLVC